MCDKNSVGIRKQIIPILYHVNFILLTFLNQLISLYKSMMFILLLFPAH